MKRINFFRPEVNTMITNEEEKMMRTYEEAIEEMGAKLEAVLWQKGHCQEKDAKEGFAELRGAMEIVAFLTGKDYVEVSADVRWVADKEDRENGTERRVD